jgi:hypothetical protein
VVGTAATAVTDFLGGLTGGGKKSRKR